MHKPLVATWLLSLGLSPWPDSPSRAPARMLSCYEARLGESGHGVEGKQRGSLGEAAREVVAAVRREAERNAKLPPARRRTGDELTELYIRTAAAAAQKLPREQAA